MDFPEGLWWEYKLKKQGLRPRVEMFDASTSGAATALSLSGITNNESEYDLLVTHSTTLGYTNLNGMRWVGIGVNDPDFGAATVWLWRMSARLVSEFNLAGMIERPILVRPGSTLWSQGEYLGADVSNTLKVSGFSFYIPKLMI